MNGTHLLAGGGLVSSLLVGVGGLLDAPPLISAAGFVMLAANAAALLWKERAPKSVPVIVRDDHHKEIAAELVAEVERAQAWPAMNSAHEGFAVLREEVDELWRHVMTNQKRRDLPAMRAEAIQIGAMAIRFVEDVVDGGRGRK